MSVSEPAWWEAAPFADLAAEAEAATSRAREVVLNARDLEWKSLESPTGVGSARDWGAPLDAATVTTDRRWSHPV